MGWNDASEIVVANNGQIYVAPVGSTLPTDPDANLAAAFVGLGLVTEDGVSISVSPEITDINAWQSRQAVRRELNAQAIQASFALEQWNEETVVLAFGGGAVTALGGAAGYRFDFPEDGDALDERALVIDAVDGSNHYRWVFPRGNVTEAVEASYQRSSAALLPITFQVLEPVDGGSPGYFLTDAAGFTAGS